MPTALVDRTKGKIHLWCQVTVDLPDDLPLDSLYTLYWVWDWPTTAIPGVVEAKEEIYTSCIDIQIA